MSDFSHIWENSSESETDAIIAGAEAEVCNCAGSIHTALLVEELVECDLETDVFVVGEVDTTTFLNDDFECLIGEVECHFIGECWIIIDDLGDCESVAYKIAHNIKTVKWLSVGLVDKNAPYHTKAGGI
jgi:hypothetical protein